jgi:hypothetical protein
MNEPEYELDYSLEEDLASKTTMLYHLESVILSYFN